MTATVKPSVNLSGLSPQTQARLALSPDYSSNEVGHGAGCTRFVEPFPLRIAADCEKVISGDNNAQIVLGRDRPTTRLSGFGGQGHTQCGMIDLSVGIASKTPQDVSAEDGSRVMANPDFQNDAARIYMSQKANIDEYMELPDGNVGRSQNRSAIGMIADDLRLVARQGIKIISTCGHPYNSQGGRIDAVYGIDLIAGPHDLQPMVKGGNLVECLASVLKRVDQLAGILNTFVLYQMNYNNVIAGHVHPMLGSPSAELVASGITSSITLSTQIQPSIYLLKQNIIFTNSNYLQQAGIKFIGSRVNRTS